MLRAQEEAVLNVIRTGIALNLSNGLRSAGMGPRLCVGWAIPR